MNQYIVSAKVDERIFTSATDEEEAKIKALDILTVDYDVNEEDVAIVEVKLI